MTEKRELIIANKSGICTLVHSGIKRHIVNTEMTVSQLYQKNHKNKAIKMKLVIKEYIINKNSI